MFVLVYDFLHYLYDFRNLVTNQVSNKTSVFFSFLQRNLLRRELTEVGTFFWVGIISWEVKKDYDVGGRGVTWGSRELSSRSSTHVARLNKPPVLNLHALIMT